MVKLKGHIVQDGKQLWMLSSAAEAGFRVTGASRLYLKLQADDTVKDPAAEPLLPRFEILVNGESFLNTRLTEKDTTVTVFDGEEKRDAEIRLIKLSECTQSLMALDHIETDGAIEPLPERQVRMEFIGDSITCGYGVEGIDPEAPFTTAVENAVKAYAFLTAEALNADAVLTSFSGYGIVSGFTEDPAVPNERELVPPIYEKEGWNPFRLPSGKQIQDISRNFGAFQPDYIVVNLGTNDLSWCTGIPERKHLFGDRYAAFLKTVRKNNPGARILCTLGVMGTGLNDEIKRAAALYCRETGDRKIRLLLLEEQNIELDGCGSYLHPSEITQRKLADKVTEEIRKWMSE